MKKFIGIMLFIAFIGCDDKVNLPRVSTLEITDITYKHAMSGGVILSDGGAPVLNRGVCFGLVNPPTLNSNKTEEGPGSGSYLSELKGLKPVTVYYARAFATTENGTGYGNVESFTTTETLQDIDGNYYDTITIGSQTWMAQDLATTHYTNGAPIPNILGNAEWIGTSTGAYCLYDNNPNYRNVYGCLYNWYTTQEGHVCPDGWHVPSDMEFQILISYLGGESVAGGKLKEEGTLHWLAPNAGATNSSGFTGLPSGNRIGNGGEFYNLKGYAIYWTADASPSVESEAINRVLVFDDTNMRIGYVNKTAGFSIRCVKD